MTETNNNKENQDKLAQEIEACASPTGAVNDEECVGGDSHDPGKMFIGGLSWQTTADSLRKHFEKFGDLTECMVMRDPATRRARGFGFITFADPASVDKVLGNGNHELDGKKIDPKVAFPKKQQPKMITRTKKIFIGGLSATSTVDDMKAYFEQFGKIEDAMLMFDKSTQRHRGFGFITFDSEDVVEKVCEIHFHEINGKMVECKKAQPKEVMLPVQLNKTRQAAARSFYALAPEQLLAATYASCLQPRFNTFGANLYYPIDATMFAQMPAAQPIMLPSASTGRRRVTQQPTVAAYDDMFAYAPSEFAVLNGYQQAMAAAAFQPASPTAARFNQMGGLPNSTLEALYGQQMDMTASYHAPSSQTAQQQAFNAQQMISAYNGYH